MKAEWISTDFAVPKKPYRVLVKVQYGDQVLIDIAEYFGDGMWERSYDGLTVPVIAWTPLPE